jgi:hypothetical protein
VVLGSRDCSSEHARVFYDVDLPAEIGADGSTPYVLEDKSSNGVFVNFVKLGKGKTHR